MKRAKLTYFFMNWKTELLPGVVLGIIIFLLITYKPWRSEPEHCRLHDGVPVNAISLIDTINGQNHELRVFPPHIVVCREIEEKETYGHMSTSFGMYYLTRSYPDDRSSETTIQTDDLPGLDTRNLKKFYCKACQEKLKSVDTPYGLVLADMYEPKKCTLYPIELGAIYQIRHYTVVVAPELNRNQEIEIKITSNYYDGGKSLDYDY